ncbi:MAG: sirohydrochlorin cobaltochelatase [Eubacteriales bacterium]
MKKALLVVSFGTSHEDTMKKNIEAIENDIAAEFSDRKFARAFTSGMIMRKLKARDGIHIDNVHEAIEELVNDGYEDILVQSTHIMNGDEYDKMTEQIAPFVDKADIKVGEALLTTSDDYDSVVEALCTEGFSEELKEKETAIVLMGHGTGHFADAAYAALDYRFKVFGNKNVFVATVEGYPELDTIIPQIKELAPKKIVLMPFMVVAGDHAKNDMAGDEEDSWKSIFKRLGYEVKCVLKGIGELPSIRKIYVEHAKKSAQ